MSYERTQVMNSERQVRRLYHEVRVHFENGGSPLRINLKDHSRDRTLPQNATLHMWIGEIAEQTGHSCKEVKDELAANFLPMIYDESLGEIRRKGTSELTVLEMDNYMIQIEALSAYSGWRLTQPSNKKRKYLMSQFVIETAFEVTNWNAATENRGSNEKVLAGDLSCIAMLSTKEMLPLIGGKIDLEKFNELYWGKEECLASPGTSKLARKLEEVEIEILRDLEESAKMFELYDTGTATLKGFTFEMKENRSFEVKFQIRIADLDAEESGILHEVVVTDQLFIKIRSKQMGLNLDEQQAA